MTLEQAEARTDLGMGWGSSWLKGPVAMSDGSLICVCMYVSPLGGSFGSTGALPDTILSGTKLSVNQKRQSGRKVALRLRVASFQIVPNKKAEVGQVRGA